MLGWLFAWLLRTNCGQKTTIWPILVAFNALKMAIYWIITLEKMNTFQPKMDRGKLIKLSSKNSVFDLLKFFLWTENNNLTSFWCIQSIQSGNLLHSNPAKNEYILAGNRPRYIDETFLGWFFIYFLVFPT